VRVREFRHAVETEFGDRGPALLHDLVLGEVGGRTAEEALKAGVAVDDVWRALCRATDVPPSRMHGVGLREPRD
jgi:hypothetical protein